MFPQVVSTVHKNFARLPIQQFFLLFNAFVIWKPTFVEDYLKQYKVPRGVNLSDGTWVEFFGAVVNRYFLIIGEVVVNYFSLNFRFSGAHSHYFIDGFLQSVAEKYQESKRGTDYILDLLKLPVKNLLAIDPEREVAMENVTKTGEDVQSSFKQFLHEFITRNSLKHTLLMKMEIIMVKYTYSSL